MAMLEHFSVLLYNMDSIDEVHQQYCQYRISSQAGHGHVNGISTTNSTTMPYWHAALVQHAMRAV